jgi:hypothetical protein
MVTADLRLANAGEPLDAIVEASVRRHGTGERVTGLLLRTLHGLQGAASFSLQWPTAGSDPGAYYVEATLADPAGTILDRSTGPFSLGIPSVEITAFAAMPTHFTPGDRIDLWLVLSNTGTMVISGTAVIQVLDAAGDLVHEFGHEVVDLAPGQEVGSADLWDTSGVAEGTHGLVAYLLYDDLVTEPRTAVVSTETHVYYLPLVMKGFP